MTNFDDMPNYDEEAVQPMRDELTAVGFSEMKTTDAVEESVGATDGTTLVVINSVCGCAAGGARPGVSLALQNSKIPDRLTTVFAGQDKGAVRKVREILSSFPPSSPFIALLKDGSPVHVMQRQDIEGKDPGSVARDLVSAFEEHCDREGPSISQEDYANLNSVQACGSSIPPATVQIDGMDAGSSSENSGHAPGSDDGGDKKSWWSVFK